MENEPAIKDTSLYMFRLRAVNWSVPHCPGILIVQDIADLSRNAVSRNHHVLIPFMNN